MRARLAVAALLCVACAEETILAAHDSRPRDAGADDERGDAGESEGACRDDDDCTNGDFCEKLGCDATEGICTRTDVSCGRAETAPVCGCDGVTYFNDCERKKRGVSVQGREPCRENAVTCGGRDPECDGPAYCVRMSEPDSMMGDVCSPDAAGQCWIMPTACDPEPQGGDRFFLCQQGPGGPGEEGDCMDLCNAIISGRPFVRVFRSCDQPWGPP